MTTVTFTRFPTWTWSSPLNKNVKDKRGPDNNHNIIELDEKLIPF